MAISKSKITADLEALNITEGLGWKSDLINAVVEAFAKADFDLQKISDRKLRQKYGLRGDNNALREIINRCEIIIEQETEKQKAEQLKLQEEMLPTKVSEEFNRFSETLIDAIKAAKVSVAEAIQDQNNFSYAQTNIRLNEKSAHYEKVIEELNEEKSFLLGHVENLKEQASTIISENKTLSEKITKQSAEIESLSKLVSDKENAEKEVARLLGRLDVYESFPKPTAPTRSRAAKK